LSPLAASDLIAADATTSSGTSGFNAVPEPSTWFLLLLAALGGLVWRGRRFSGR
jgi:hypothetical protein